MHTNHLETALEFRTIYKRQQRRRERGMAEEETLFETEAMERPNKYTMTQKIKIF